MNDVWLTQTQPAISQALQVAGYDLIDDPQEAGLVQARRDQAMASSNLVIDSGGQLRFTLTRQIGPEQAQKHQAAGFVLDVTRQTNETLTVSYSFDLTKTTDFARFLDELDQI